MTGIEMLREYAECGLSEDTCGRVPNMLDKECDDFARCSECHMVVCNAIADQIERETERTCELTRVEDCSGLVQGTTQWRTCSRCGIEVLAYPATYCPCCGAKVVKR